MSYLIRYTYPGTRNGRPVGDVYVTGPHFGTDIWSHTYEPSKAARWRTRAEAEAALRDKRWNGHVIPEAKATVLA